MAEYEAMMNGTLPQKLLQNQNISATIQAEDTDTVQVSRADLEKEHSLLLARIHQLRKLLKYPPLLTGKELDRQAQK